MTHLQLLQHNTKALQHNTEKKKKHPVSWTRQDSTVLFEFCCRDNSIEKVNKSTTALWLVAHDSWTIRQTRKRTSAYGKNSQTLSESILSFDLCAKAFHRSWSKHIFLLWPAAAAAAARGSLARELPSDHNGIGKNSVCVVRVWERKR